MFIAKIISVEVRRGYQTYPHEIIANVAERSNNIYIYIYSLARKAGVALHSRTKKVNISIIAVFSDFIKYRNLFFGLGAPLVLGHMFIFSFIPSPLWFVSVFAYFPIVLSYSCKHWLIIFIISDECYIHMDVNRTKKI